MLSLSTKRLDYLAAGEYTDARYARIVRRDGVTIGITTHSEDQTLGGTLYQSGSGYAMSSLKTTDSLTVDNLNITGVYGVAGIQRDHLLGGLYDDADMYIFDTDYLNPVEDEHPKRSGHLGQVTLYEHRFEIEFRSLTQMMQQIVGRTYTAKDFRRAIYNNTIKSPPVWQAEEAVTVRDILYDAESGDTRQPTVYDGRWAMCTKAGTTGLTEPSWPALGYNDLVDGTAEWTSVIAPIQRATVSAVIDERTFEYTGSLAPFEQWHKYGEVTWTGGNNALLKMECIDNPWIPDPPSSYFKRVVLFLPMQYPVEVGDTFEIEFGYDRSWEQCDGRFLNIYNFQGFPFIPGATDAGKTGNPELD